MASVSSSGAEIPPSMRTRRLREVIAGRQTRADIVVSCTLLTLAVAGKLYLLHLTWDAFLQQNGCGPALCPADAQFDMLAILLVACLAIGVTFGAHGILKMLNRRNAWTYALGDAAVTVGALIASLYVTGVL